MYYTNTHRAVHGADLPLNQGFKDVAQDMRTEKPCHATALCKEVNRR
jgi:hypothetical protein